MKFIDYNKDFMSLAFHWKWKGTQHDKYFTFPLRTWWKVRKYFKRPRLKFYFGPNQIKDAWFEGNKELGLEPGWLYKEKGIYPFASTEFLKWHTPKWFPVWIGSSDIYWKDKYNEPRYERPGYFVIFFGRDYRKGWQFSVSFETPVYEYEKYDPNSGKLRYYKTYPDTYWDMVIWTAFYYSEYGCEKPDIKKAHDLFPFSRVSTSDSVHIDNNSENYSLEWLEPVETILGNDYRVLKLKFNNERTDNQFTKYFDNYASYKLSEDLSSEYSLSINWNYLTGCIRYSGYKTSKYMRYDWENDELFIYFLDGEFDNDGLVGGGLPDLNREGVNIHFTSPLYPIYNKWRIEFLTDKAKKLIYKEKEK